VNKKKLQCERCGKNVPAITIKEEICGTCRRKEKQDAANKISRKERLILDQQAINYASNYRESRTFFLDLRLIFIVLVGLIFIVVATLHTSFEDTEVVKIWQCSGNNYTDSKCEGKRVKFEGFITKNINSDTAYATTRISQSAFDSYGSKYLNVEVEGLRTSVRVYEKYIFDGIIEGSSWSNLTTIDIKYMKELSLSEVEKAEIAEIKYSRETTISPSQLYEDARVADNKEMSEIADNELEELIRTADSYSINPSWSAQFALYTFRMNDGSIKMCKRGFAGDILVFDCSIAN
jgi:hypothetical protein